MKNGDRVPTVNRAAPGYPDQKGKGVDVKISSQVTFYGTPVVPGIAYGPVMWAQSAPELPTSFTPITPDQVGPAIESFTNAADIVGERLSSRAALANGTAADILSVAASFARDNGWRKSVIQKIEANQSAVQATIEATQVFIDLFTSQGGMMAERVTDLADMRNRVVAELQGQPEPGVPSPAEPSILFADDLAPADTAGLDPEKILGIVTKLGGPTSHTSIIARQLGIPAIVATREAGTVSIGDLVIMDGGSGQVSKEPDPDQASSIAGEDLRWREAAARWTGPARTNDGCDLELLANVQDGAGAARAATSPAGGIGLFRTELAFLGAETEPSPEKQAEVYREVLDRFPDSKVVIRTLDAGSDKPLKFITLPDEDNPALGVRGIRTTGIDKGHLYRQLDAIAQAAEGRLETCWVMAPMVATVSETEWFVGLVRERGMRGGIMVEVPSVAIMIDKFLPHVDFVSIGTNDLSQYVMAADRMSPNLAEYTDPWQPAVLTLINQVAAAGRQAGVPVGVCGEAAADPMLAGVLVGMGVTSLSMASSALALVGSRLESHDMEDFRSAAAAVVASADPGTARYHAARFLAPESIGEH